MRLPLVLAFALLPAAASAGGLGGRLSFGGGGDLDDPGPDISGNLDLSVGTPHYGVTLGVQGIFTPGDSAHETYATVDLLTARGTISAGVPRPAYDLFAPSALDPLFPRQSLDIVPTTRSHVTTGAMFLSETPLGVSWRGEAEALSLGVSDGATVVGAGMTRTVGGWTVAGAVEGVAGGEADGANAKFGIGHALGDAAAGATLFLPGTRATSPLLEGALAADRLGLHLTGVAQVGGGGPRLALAAERAVARYGTLRAVLAHGANGAAADLALDLRF